MSDGSGFQVPPELRHNPFADYFDRVMPDAFKPLSWAQDTADGLPTIRKLSATVLVPDELLMDAGIIPDTRPPRPPLPWRWRIRNRIGDWRERAARRAYRIIAGYDIYEPEEC